MNEKPKSNNREARRLVEVGASFVAGVLLVAAGLLTVLVGISAIADNELFILAPQWVFRLNVEVWGWIHVVLGILMVAGGFAVMFRFAWARISAVALAVASMVVFFLWVPYYPVWSIVVIALNVVVIWAVAAWDTPASRPPES